MNEDVKDKQHTAVQWLYNKLQSECLIDMADDIFEQAKQMEREQIIDAFDEGNPNGFIDKTGEDYYTQTYGE